MPRYKRLDECVRRITEDAVGWWLREDGPALPLTSEVLKALGEANPPYNGISLHDWVADHILLDSRCMLKACWPRWFSQFKGVTQTEALSRRLCHALNSSPKWRVRKAAAFELGRMRPEARSSEVLRVLFNALQTDRRGKVRKAAATGLGRLASWAANPDVINTLLNAVYTDRKGVRGASVEALAKMGEAVASQEVIEAMRAVLQESGHHTRNEAANVLRNVADIAPQWRETIIEILLETLCHPPASVFATDHVDDSIVRVLDNLPNDRRMQVIRSALEASDESNDYAGQQLYRSWLKHTSGYVSASVLPNREADMIALLPQFKAVLDARKKVVASGQIIETEPEEMEAYLYIWAWCTAALKCNIHLASAEIESALTDWR